MLHHESAHVCIARYICLCLALMVVSAYSIHQTARLPTFFVFVDSIMDLTFPKAAMYSNVVALIHVSSSIVAALGILRYPLSTLTVIGRGRTGSGASTSLIVDDKVNNKELPYTVAVIKAPPVAPFNIPRHYTFQAQYIFPPSRWKY